MKTVYLHGRLGKIFGKVWRLDVQTPAEALRAINTRVKSLAKYIADSEQRGVLYKVVVGNGKEIETAKELNVGYRHDTSFHFYPVALGCKKNYGASVFSFIAAAILYIVAFVLLIVTKGASLKLSMALIQMGNMMFYAGVIGLILAPDVPEVKEATDDSSSTFGSATNTTRQGVPIPIGYGEMIVGSAVINLSVRSEKIATVDNSLTPEDLDTTEWQTIVR